MFYINITRCKKRIAMATLLVGVFLLSGITIADAATIYLKPSASTVSVGNIVSVKVYVNTDGRAVNNAEGTVQFPTDLLDVLSITKSGSIFSLWVEEPTFSNYNGTINFNGGVPNPGFVGSAGEVASITFKAKKAGSASVIFGGAAVRENDGLGTDILASKISTTIKVDGVAQTKTQTLDVPAPAKSSVPDKPVVVSNTHQKQDVWYKNNTASFSWKVPSSVTSVQASLNTKQLVIPTVAYDGSVSQKTLNDVADGLYYFNLRQQNSAGWSATAHYKVQIDTAAPNEFAPVVGIENNKNVVILDATDSTSGISHYLVSIDSAESVRVDAQSLADGKYTLPVMAEGSHLLNVIAYDKAENKREVKVSFTSPEVTPPEISLSQEKIELGDGVVVSGTTLYSNTKVEVLLRPENGDVKKYNVITNSDGSFVLDVESIDTAGIVAVSSSIIFGENEFSKSSKIVQLEVSELAAVQDFKKALYRFSGIVGAILLIALFIFLLYLGWHRFFGLKKKINNDLLKTAKSIHKTMAAFREELDSQLAALERVMEDRELNKKERKIFNEIKQNIDNIDDFIEKKIKEIL